MLMRGLVLCLLPFFATRPILAQTACGNVQLQLAPDYSFAIGSSTGGSAYTLTLGGKALAQGPLPQLALFHYDGSLTSTSGVAPSAASGIAYDVGKFGKGVYLQPGGQLAYPAANLTFAEGTIEMWVSPRYNGYDLVFASGGYNVFFYVAPNGDYFGIGEYSPGHDIGTSSSVNGQYQGAENPSAGDISGWKAGEWHHIAVTFSASANRIKFYLDGVKIADTNANHYVPPSASGGAMQLGTTAFTIDEVRMSKAALPDSIIAYDAAHSTAFPDNEVIFPLAGVAPGQLNYSVTGCGTAVYSFPGVPITNLDPPAGLLSAGSTSFRAAFSTIQPTTCRYSVGSAQDYASMRALDTGPPAAAHQGTVNGVSSDPRVINRVYFRCASNPDYLLAATYRTLAPPGQPFPRIGNIWLGGYLLNNAPGIAQKTQLFVGANSSDTSAPGRVAQLRNVNPGVLNILAMIPEETQPDDYFLKDVHGKPIANWCVPEIYLPNQTKPEVAEFFARTAYQQLAKANFLADGIFFDQFNTTIQQPFNDCHGNRVQIDADGDGIADDPATLNAAWKAGMYAMVNAFRRLAPNAYAMAHIVQAPAAPEDLAAFNGIGLEFFPQSVREGQMPFGTLWDLYQSWDAQGVPPALNMIQACPPNQLAYGYGYAPTKAMLPSTIAFAQSAYPNMRFGLGLTLMRNGFFGFDFGDSAPPITWWYDEYDFNLGYPIGPAVQIAADKPANLFANGGFEADLARWRLNVANDGVANATVTADTGIVAEGHSSAHIHLSSAGTANGQVSLGQAGLAMFAGVEYRVQFWARADSPRVIIVSASGVGTTNPFPIAIGSSWNLYSASFIASATGTAGQLNFGVGDVAGDVWLDDVQLYPQTAAVYRRDFANGVVLLNGTASPQAVTLEPGLKRFTGTQAPLYQYMIDDAGSQFSASGSWRNVIYDTGTQYGSGTGPYYHCWQASCYQSDAGAGQAQWKLNIPADGQYTIQVWLPAAPGAATWTKSAVYEVIAGEKVLASATIDQTTATAGDALHLVATLSLRAADAPFLRVRNGGSGSLIADAVYVTSAARYNDGSPAQQVNLGGFDSILLQRQQPVAGPVSQVNSVANAASYQPAIASGGFVSIVGTGFGNSSRSWTSSDFSGSNLPVSLDGVSVTINGKPAYVEYISSTQINAIAPDDDTIGPVPVQVTTPQGASYAGTVLKQKLSPGLFTYQSGATIYAAAVHLDGTLVGPAGPSSRPAVPGEVIEVYGTGFGATTPATPTAQLVSQAAPTTLPVTMTIGGATAEVQWAGVVSSGLYQLNVRIPNLGTGDQAVQANMSGFQTAPSVLLSVSSN
jgi:uncharacterized protein (TIGR03437 family)